MPGRRPAVPAEVAERSEVELHHRPKPALERDQRPALVVVMDRPGLRHVVDAAVRFPEAAAQIRVVEVREPDVEKPDAGEVLPPDHERRAGDVAGGKWL